MRPVSAILLLMLPALSCSEDSIGQAMRLTVRPVLCIVDERSRACDMSFLVVWQSEESGYYCVGNDLESEPLRCWTEQHSGELTDRRNVLADFEYWINRGGDAPKLAVVTVEVLRMDSDDRRRRRRTRHVWDIL